MYDCAYAVPVMTAKCKLITLPHITRVHNYTMPGKKQEKERKMKEAAAMCQDIIRYTKKAKQVGLVGDDSLTGPVVAGRLDETINGKHIR